VTKRNQGIASNPALRQFTTQLTIYNAVTIDLHFPPWYTLGLKLEEEVNSGNYRNV
jgi:hypothetical protein